MFGGLPVQNEGMTKAGNAVNLSNLSLGQFPGSKSGSFSAGPSGKEAVGGVNFNTTHSISDTGALTTNGRVPSHIRVKPLLNELNGVLKFSDQIIVLNNKPHEVTSARNGVCRYTAISIPMFNLLMYRKAENYFNDNVIDDDTVDTILSEWRPYGVFYSQIRDYVSTSYSSDTWNVHVKGTVDIKNIWNISVNPGDRLYVVLKRCKPPKRYSITPTEEYLTNQNLNPFQLVPVILPSTSKILSKHTRYKHVSENGEEKEYYGKAFSIGRCMYNYTSSTNTIGIDSKTQHTPYTINQQMLQKCQVISIHLEITQV
jgi:hypothetical protein